MERMLFVVINALLNLALRVSSLCIKHAQLFEEYTQSNHDFTDFPHRPLVLIVQEKVSSSGTFLYRWTLNRSIGRLSGEFVQHNAARKLPEAGLWGHVVILLR